MSALLYHFMLARANASQTHDLSDSADQPPTTVSKPQRGYPVAITILEDESIRIYGGTVIDGEGNHFRIRHLIPQPTGENQEHYQLYDQLYQLAKNYGTGIMDDQGFHPPSEGQSQDKVDEA